MPCSEWNFITKWTKDSVSCSGDPSCLNLEQSCVPTPSWLKTPRLSWKRILKLTWNVTECHALYLYEFTVFIQLVVSCSWYRPQPENVRGEPSNQYPFKRGKCSKSTTRTAYWSGIYRICLSELYQSNGASWKMARTSIPFKSDDHFITYTWQHLAFCSTMLRALYTHQMQLELHSAPCTALIDKIQGQLNRS